MQNGPMQAHQISCAAWSSAKRGAVAITTLAKMAAAASPVAFVTAVQKAVALVTTASEGQRLGQR